MDNNVIKHNKVLLDDLDISDMIKGSLSYYRYDDGMIGVDLCLWGSIEVDQEEDGFVLKIYGDNYVDVMTECLMYRYFTEKDFNYYSISGIFTRWMTI